MRVSCPHCREFVELSRDAGVSNIHCPTCQNRFSLSEEATVDYVGPADSPPRSVPPMPDRVGKYHVSRKLGDGALAEVWEARDEESGSIVVLKVIRDAETNTARAKRLRLEARALARLQHPNIVRLHEVGSAKGLVYIACEYVPGTRLDKWRLDKQPSPLEAAAVSSKIARAWESGG